MDERERGRKIRMKFLLRQSDVRFENVAFDFSHISLTSLPKYTFIISFFLYIYCDILVTLTRSSFFALTNRFESVKFRFRFRFSLSLTHSHPNSTFIIIIIIIIMIYIILSIYIVTHLLRLHYRELFRTKLTNLTRVVSSMSSTHSQDYTCVSSLYVY